MRAAEEAYRNPVSGATGFTAMQQGISAQNGSAGMSVQEMQIQAVPEASGKEVVSPMVGTFYAAPSEG
jgi:biotin carboxyl carrier protein